MYIPWYIVHVVDVRENCAPVKRWYRVDDDVGVRMLVVGFRMLLTSSSIPSTMVDAYVYIIMCIALALREAHSLLMSPTRAKPLVVVAGSRLTTGATDMVYSYKYVSSGPAGRTC